MTDVCSSNEPGAADAERDVRVSVVIPTYQRRDLVAQNVAAFAAQTFRGSFEVVVVVDGSTDGSARSLRSLEATFPLTVIEQANAGAAAARNRGAEQARGEVLLFLDDDMEPDRELIAEHDRSHREGADLVLGHVPLHRDSPRTFLSTAAGRWAEERARLLSAPGAVPGVRDFITGQLSISRDLFQQLDGFQTQFRGFGNEDLDLGLRAVDSGCRVVFNPSAISRQRYIVTPGMYLRQRRQLGVADVLLARLRPELADMLLGDARETPLERMVLRWFRPLFTRALAAAFAMRADSKIGIRWFSRVRRLEYLQGVREAGGVPARRPVRVLCYHSISRRRGALAPYGVPPAQFRAQIDFLRRRFRFITGDELLRLLDGAGGVPRRALLLTFDDCYRDLLEAAEDLAGRSIPAVAFAVTRRLGGTNEWDASLGDSVPLLDERGLKRLGELGMKVGSHSRTHAKLTRLGTEDARAELGGALEDLSALGVRFLPLVAYPHGINDDRVRMLAAQAGYRAGFTVDPGVVDADVSEPFALPRIEIHRGDRGPIFWWKVCRPRRRPRRRRAVASLQSAGATRGR